MIHIFLKWIKGFLFINCTIHGRAYRIYIMIKKSVTYSVTLFHITHSRERESRAKLSVSVVSPHKCQQRERDFKIFV